MNSIPFFAEGTGWARTHYELETEKKAWCTDTLEQLGACTSIAEAVDFFRRQEQHHRKEIKEYDIGASLNGVLITANGIKSFVQEIKARVGQVPRLLQEHQEKKDRLRREDERRENKLQREHKQGRPHCTQLWKSLTRTMGYAHSFPSSFFFRGNELAFCEKMYGCEGVVFRHLYEQLKSTGHRNKRRKTNTQCFSSNTVIDSILLNIFQFVCDCSLYMPRTALQYEGEHLVQCSCCYKARMGEQILRTGNPKMCRHWFNMTTVPWEPHYTPCICEKEDAYYPTSPPYSPSYPAYRPTSPSYDPTHL